MQRHLSIAVLLLGLLLAARPARAADRILLKTGAILTGRIVKETDRSVTIEIEGLGKLVVLRSKIASIEGRPRRTESPAPAPAVPAPRPREKPEPGAGAGPASPSPPARDPVDVPWEEVRAGRTVLLICRGEDHGGWRDPGRRFLGRIDAAGPRRLKIEVDPEAGVLGFAWIPKERVRRIIRITGYPERRFFFFEGIETGAWIEGKTRKGRFAGRLAAVSGDGTVTILHPEGGKVRTVDLPLEEIVTLSAVIRGKPLAETLAGLVPGEPVTLRVRGREEPVRGLLREKDRAWLTLLAAGKEGEPPGEVPVYLGLPLTEVRVLPETLRPAFRDARLGDAFTAVTAEESATAVVRRSFTGRLLGATTEEIVLDTGSGRKILPVSGIVRLFRPDPARTEALLSERDAAGGESALAVLPGMSRAEVEKRLPGEHPGIDLLYEEDRVVRVYCRSPFTGPVFGIRIGEPVADALRDTDLDFDVQIDPKSEDPTAVTTMLSHSLRGLVVRLFVTRSGTVLAAEVSAR